MRFRGPAYIVLLIALSVSLAVTLWVNNVSKNRENARFLYSTGELQQTIESGVNSYLTLLDSVRAFAVAKISMNPAQYHAFVEALDLRKKYPGIKSLGLAVKIPAALKGELIRKSREQGLAQFEVWPESDRPEICPLITVEPLDDRNKKMVGFDLFSEVERRATANLAADSGNPTATAAIHLEPQNDPRQNGFLVLVPVYQKVGHPASIEQRRANIAGFVQCAFATDDLMRAVVGANTNSTLALQVFDGASASGAAPMYQSQSWSSAQSSALKTTNVFSVADRPWTVVIAAQPHFISASDPTAITLLAGVLLSLMLWRITLSQTHAREAAERHALELKQSESALKCTEVEIRELNANLEHRVAKRTAELELAVEELKAFSYTVSHDLRAPLRHIDGYVSLLSENEKLAGDADAQRQAKIICTSAKRMGQLIDALLNFSRIGWINLNVKPQVDVNEIVREVREILAPEIKNRAIEWDIADLPKVNADPTLLRQVFANLISNAIKYSGPRSPARIAIGSENREQEIVFFVRDNGVGFDMNYADKLFSVFQRLHSDKEFEGTGIGLANIRKIIARHGGRTWAEGKSGEGAIFYFTLPKDSSVRETGLPDIVGK